MHGVSAYRGLEAGRVVERAEPRGWVDFFGVLTVTAVPSGPLRGVSWGPSTSFAKGEARIFVVVSTCHDASSKFAPTPAPTPLPLLVPLLLSLR